MIDNKNPSNQDVVDWDGLVYYDNKIKTYINDRLEAVSADLKDINELETRVDMLSTASAKHAAEIEALKEERDDLESAVLVLQSEDKLLHQDIADLRVAVENVVTEEDLNDLASKEFVRDQILELSDNFSSDVTVLTDAVAEIQSDLETFASQESVDALTSAVRTVEHSLKTEYATKSETEGMITTQVNETLSNQLDETVEEIITTKIETGEIQISPNMITYGEF